MNSGDVLRYVMILAGVYLLGLSVMSLAKRKMTEPFCLAWVFFSGLMILGGDPAQAYGYQRLYQRCGIGPDSFDRGFVGERHFLSEQGDLGAGAQEPGTEHAGFSDQ